MPAVRHASFAPHVASDARLLILGSLPGARSLAARQYYAHPTNQFWRLLGAVTGLPLASLSYEDRLAQLPAARLGLWDVIRTAARRTSSDGGIRDAERPDLPQLVQTLPDRCMRALTGGTAAGIGRRLLSATARSIMLIGLPSSSAAHTIGFDAKLAGWMRLGEAR